MRLSKIWCFVSSEQINYSPKPKAEANNRSAIVLLVSHRVCFLINIFEKLPFSHKSAHKKEKNVVSFTHEQNIICCQTQLDDIAHEQASCQTQLDDIAHEQAIICGQLFTSHMVGSANEKEEKFALDDNDY